MKFIKSPVLPSLVLIISCLMLILIAPMAGPYLTPEFYELTYLIIIISAIFTLGTNRVLIGALIVMLILQTASHLIESQVLAITTFITNMFLFLLVVVKLTIVIASKKNVTTVILLDAVSAYLLIGISFFLFNLIIRQIHPEAIQGPEGSVDQLGHIMYYTFTTYTTLGYGDFTPAIPMAQSLSTLTAVSGQVYLTIVIAMIVGKFLAKTTNRKPD